MKILAGIYPYGDYKGKIVYNGREAKFGSVNDSEKAGIGIIHQELALVAYLSIAENLFLGSKNPPNWA